ncbi:conserved hypothetical protein [Talaromyces stipitatus ATCC 10500]|uniref:HTH CENPB-type domain-containing protein n=1 Tax=Talaromyces stipitatus (strain ATCC 10500 / CBS 375.48 / QM 6759 / NRRL 1006) TaxID=441959 RepID=B8LYM9_TALSN|nr:uncharacterized protein TSTA_068140 [Talaromyces stipitatus ATCC 10500]EED23387.1 conserved hypothetical protein [Talaromyces stipitatus ATCC 10500]
MYNLSQGIGCRLLGGDMAGLLISFRIHRTDINLSKLYTGSISIEYATTTVAYDHRVWKTGLPVRSAVLKPHAGWLVIWWVTTSESQLLPGGGRPGLKGQNLQNLNLAFTNVKTRAKMTPKLYKEEDELIAKALSAPPTNQQIEESANYLLGKDFSGPGEPPRAGKNWVHDFIKRLPKQYVRIVQKPQEKERTVAEHYGEVERWFIDLELAIQQYKIRPQNLWNFDETGFIVGQGKDEAVVTAYPKTSKRVSSLSSRESITVVEGINAEGKIIPPLLIPKGKVHLEEWYRHIKDDDWLVAPASNGFITDEIAFEWLQHFDHFSRPGAFPDWRLILIDNHTTHLTIQFVQYCEIWHIRPFRFPPHSTHFLQPLDGVPFQQYKHVHGRVVNKIARLGGFDFDKNDFFEELRDIRIRTFTTRTIRHGWRERGIWPLNPRLILDTMLQPEEAFEAFVAEGDALKIYGEADDTIPSSPTTKSISPPSTAVKLRRYVNKIEKSIDGIKDILTNLTLAELGDLHRESFAKVRDTATRKNQKTTKRQVKASGVPYVKDANRLIKRRHDGDLLKIYKSHAVGVPQPMEEAASTEPQNSGFFFDTQGNR